MSTDDSLANRVLLAIAIVQSAIYAYIAWLSRAFADGTNLLQRPIVFILVLFAASFGLYVITLRVAVGSSGSRRLTWLIIVPAVAFRCLMLPSQPIQEIDIYRYMWDGAVTAQGVSPYRYAPAEVKSTKPDDEVSQDLRQLVNLREESPSLGTILNRVHYPELRTIYPPVSQAVFASVHWLVPVDAPVAVRLTTVKGVLLLFDIGTIACVWCLLQMTGKHPGWLLAYAWCPLVIKEFANSGHLDSIAVFFTTAALCLLTRYFVAAGNNRNVTLMVGAILLGLAIGAKLYPMVLLPLCVAGVAAKGQFIRAGVFGVTVLGTAGLYLAPMFLPMAPQAEVHSVTQPPLPDAVEQSSTLNATPERNSDDSSGVAAFFTRWEMNDFLFMLIVENLRPADTQSQSPPAWFIVVPNTWREIATNAVATYLAVDRPTASFLATRALTATMFCIVALVMACRVYRHPEANKFLEAAFLSLAWFWLLLPTQNPWYWTWVMPLLPFARGRAWLAVSGLVLLYYLRFWLLYHHPNGPILCTSYSGAAFFDYVVTWVEYGPWLVWLAAAAALRRRLFGRQTKSPSVYSFTEPTTGSAYDSFRKLATRKESISHD